MAFMAVLESDLRALSAEARRRYPAVKDGAEHAILKVLDFINLLHELNYYIIESFLGFFNYTGFIYTSLRADFTCAVYDTQ